MSYSVLVYHEIRESGMLRAGETSPIEVAQAYKDQLPAPLFATLEQFAEQMAYLAENNYHTLTLSELEHYHYDNGTLPEKSILLTFDDCYQSIGLYAYPILKKYGFHAVAFVVTGWLNAQQKRFTPEHSVCMTPEELKQMTDVFEYANRLQRRGNSVRIQQQMQHLPEQQKTGKSHPLAMEQAMNPSFHHGSTLNRCRIWIVWS